MTDNIYWFVVLFLFFTPLERLFPHTTPQKIFRKGFVTDVLHFFVTQSIAWVGLICFLALIIPLNIRIIPASVTQSITSLPFFIQCLIGVLILEMSSYWAHRASHEIPFLWKFHAIHHKSEEMDWLVVMKSHPLDLLYMRIFAVLPLIVLGLDVRIFGAYLIFRKFHTVFIHSNLRMDLGPLRWIVGNPAFHHWHHSREPVAQNKNYSGLMPWLDRIFGTAYFPRDHTTHQFGISEKIPHDYQSEILSPFAPLLRHRLHRFCGTLIITLICLVCTFFSCLV